MEMSTAPSQAERLSRLFLTSAAIIGRPATQIAKQGKIDCMSIAE